MDGEARANERTKLIYEKAQASEWMLAARTLIVIGFEFDLISAFLDQNINAFRR